MNKEKLNMSEGFDCIEVFGTKVLFSNARIRADEVPDGLHLYHIRHDDDGEFCTLERNVVVNHAASILSATALLGEEEYRNLGEDYNFAVDGSDEMSVAEYLAEQEQAQAPTLEM